MSSRPDCIFEIHQQWQSGFSRVYSNCCCSCWFEAEIIKIGQSSHKMYSNKILNFQESTTILNTHTKKVCKLNVCPSYIYIYILILTILFGPVLTHSALLILSSFASPIPNNRQRKQVYICKDAYHYMRKYKYFCMCERQHRHKLTNIQKHTNLCTHTHKQNPHSNNIKKRLLWHQRPKVNAF